MALSGLFLSGCDWNTKDDYNPKKEYLQFLKTQEEIKAAAEKAGPAAQVAEVPGKKTYETFCVACHGADGKADGPGSLALNPRPRNLTDKTWQAKVDDAHIAKVIKEGGASVGLSGTMAAWGAVIPDSELPAVVSYVRSFGK
jgi:mono/diheme cytochrome c family protein